MLTPTHRARIALAKVGIEAKTIHSAIYVPVESRSVEVINKEIAQAEHLLNVATRTHFNPDRQEVLARFDRQLRELREELETDVQFRPRRENSILGRSVIVDEASMVGGKLLTDIQRSGPASLCLVG